MTTQKMAYALLRICIGMSMFGHGLVRLPKLSMFALGMTESFKDSMLPEAFVLSFGYAIPVLELAVGILLLLGAFTKQALIIGTLLMICLIFGSTLVENWNAINAQLIHASIFVSLLAFIKYNSYAVDSALRSK